MLKSICKHQNTKNEQKNINKTIKTFSTRIFQSQSSTCSFSTLWQDQIRMWYRLSTTRQLNAEIIISSSWIRISTKMKDSENKLVYLMSYRLMPIQQQICHYWKFSRLCNRKKLTQLQSGGHSTKHMEKITSSSAQKSSMEEDSWPITMPFMKKSTKYRPRQINSSAQLKIEVQKKSSRVKK